MASRRSTGIEPSVFLAMISPITLGLMLATGALLVFTGAPWWAAVIGAAAVWVIRVVVARAVAARVRTLPRRIDPFALREPWRFHVRDALRAQKRFAEAVDAAPDGPLRTRLDAVGERITTGVDAAWQTALRAQALADARRRIDVDALRFEQAAVTSDAARASLDAQIASAERMDVVLAATEEQLDTIEARLGEAAAAALELAHRGAGDGDLERLSTEVETAVVGLESVRSTLDGESPSGR